MPTVISLSLMSAAFLDPSQPNVKLMPSVMYGFANASPHNDWIPAKDGEIFSPVLYTILWASFMPPTGSVIISMTSASKSASSQGAMDIFNDGKFTC